jgi:hypothetical protein
LRGKGLNAETERRCRERVRRERGGAVLKVRVNEERDRERERREIARERREIARERCVVIGITGRRGQFITSEF